MKIFILYHADCFDGLAAAWVANNKLVGDKVLMPCKYGAPPPDIEQFRGNVVYLLDFSYSATYLLKVANTANMLQVIDHHKTAQSELEGMPWALFDMNRSGAGLTWDFFHPDQNRPHLVNYIEDRDLWRFRMQHSEEVHAWIASWPKDITIYDSLAKILDVNFEDCVTEGRAILRYQDQKIEEFCTESYLIEIAGYKVPTVNVPYQFGSNVAHHLLELYPNAPFASYHFISKEGQTKFGLRGRDTDDFDVSEVARKFGGGGHAKASGFTSTGEVSIFTSTINAFQDA